MREVNIKPLCYICGKELELTSNWGIDWSVCEYYICSQNNITFQVKPTNCPICNSPLIFAPQNSSYCSNSACIGYSLKRMKTDHYGFIINYINSLEVIFDLKTTSFIIAGKPLPVHIFQDRFIFATFLEVIDYIGIPAL